MATKENKIADAIDGVGVEISNAFYQGITVGLDTETYNAILCEWNETNRQLERIADALTNKEEG